MKALLISISLLMMAYGSASSAEQPVYTLQDSYDAALSSYEGIKISEENVVQAESRIDQAWTYIYPRLNAYGAYTRYNDTLPPNGGAFLFQPLGQMQASLVLTQPLYTGGRTLAALRAAKAMRESSKSGLTSSQQNILLGVAEAYYGVIKAQKIVEVSKASLERMERHKKVTEREASTRKSKANASSLLRAKSMVEQSRINLILAEDSVKIARRKLALLTRLPENSAVVEPSPMTEPQGSIESLIETALKYRDDYTSSKLNTEVAKENVTITRGAHYPQVYAEAGLRYQDSSPTTMMDATTYYGGVRLQIPIFEGGLRKAEVSEARSKQRQTELSSVLLRRTIENEVQEELINCQTQSAVLETARRQFEFAKGNFDTVENLFVEGLVPSLSVIDAQQGLFLAERDLIAAAIGREMAILRLQKSLGVLGKKV